MTHPSTHGDRNETPSGVPILPGWHRALVVADIHSNIQALDAILAHVRGQGGFTLVHGVPAWPQDRYLHERGQARRALGQIATRHLVTGHTHLLLALRFADDPTGMVHPDRLRTGNATSFDLAGGRFILNPGSVGQPRDGDPRASCLVLDFGATASEGVVVAVHRVSYDIATVQARIREAGLPRYLHDRLADRKDEWTEWMVVTGDAWLHRDAVAALPAPFPARHGIRPRARLRQIRRMHQAS
ncbi:MAG: hypothetical protein EXR45_08790 [Chloroflexi bacterium]|nr:hypothetical protein [Chloroflexota bacterium]